MPSVNIL